MTVAIRISLTFIILAFCARAKAQLPVCGGGSGDLIYFIKDSLNYGSCIYNYDPSLPLSSTNPWLNTAIPPFIAGGAGLALGPNISGSGPSLTFYTTSSVAPSQYYYFDGSSWVNTGHASGHKNIGAGGGFIYSITPGGVIYKYDGSGDATLLITVPGWSSSGSVSGGGPYDLAADCEGNFYVLTGSYPCSLKKFDPSGNLIQSWSIPGPTFLTIGPSLEIIADTVYAGDANQIWRGVLNGPILTLSLMPGYIPLDGINDGAACPRFLPKLPGVDTAFYCGSGPGVVLNAQGQPPYSWSVLSGPAVINGTGASVSVTTVNDAMILATGSGGYCGPYSDTFRIVVPKAAVHAGSDDSLISCGDLTTTLSGSLSDTVSWLSYALAWSPAASILSGINSLTPVISPTSSGFYVLTVSTPVSQGGCSWKDTVNITIEDSAVHADFAFYIHYGCNEDTVIFNNVSVNTINNYWNFADGSLPSPDFGPSHIYPYQNDYNVTLIAANGQCSDTVEKNVDTKHLLNSSFLVDDDTICQGSLVHFINTSVYSAVNGPSSFFWDFEDGSTDTSINPTHAFTDPGHYGIILIASDFIPCHDTSYYAIIVDSMPYLRLNLEDSVLCEGQASILTAIYQQDGNTGLNWDFGDGNSANVDRSIAYAYDTSGIFNIRLTGLYRACRDTFIDRPIRIKPFPVIDLGPDTVMCLGNNSISITDYRNQSDPLAFWRWNTGDTTPSIAVRHPGIYAARVTIDGCSSDDSVEVFKDCYIDIPNSFTPNGDGINDYYLPREVLSSGLVDFKMHIYNRWGQLIFATGTIDGRGWDGKLNNIDQPAGVYVYLIEATVKNGQYERYQGNVTLLR